MSVVEAAPLAPAGSRASTATWASHAALQTRKLRMAFGGLTIFHGLDFELRKGERHAVVVRARATDRYAGSYGRPDFRIA